MLRKIIPSIFLVALVGMGPAFGAASDPTVHQIYQAAQSGHLAQAEQMVNQVIQDHPQSGEAHYVAAEVYARGGDFSTARRELAAAESLEPGLPFARRQSVAALRAELSQSRIPPRVQTIPYGATYARPHSAPWGLIIVIVAGLVIVWALVRRRRMQQPMGVYPPYPGQPMGSVGPVVPPSYPYAGGPGSGLMGSLGTGLAVGAGVAAGEELVRHVLGGGTASGGVIPPANAGEVEPAPGNDEMGGQDFGVSGGSSWDDGSGGGGDAGGGDFGVGGDDWT